MNRPHAKHEKSRSHASLPDLPPLWVEEAAPELSERIIAAAAALPRRRMPFRRRWPIPAALWSPRAVVVCTCLCVCVAVLFLYRGDLVSEAPPVARNNAPPVLEVRDGAREVEWELPLFSSGFEPGWEEEELDPGDYLVLAVSGDEAPRGSEKL